ncbi:hypothetical protein L345_16091, partial [Ophiophagus hannah]
MAKKRKSCEDVKREGPFSAKSAELFRDKAKNTPVSNLRTFPMLFVCFFWGCVHVCLCLCKQNLPKSFEKASPAGSNSHFNNLTDVQRKSAYLQKASVLLKMRIWYSAATASCNLCRPKRTLFSPAEAPQQGWVSTVFIWFTELVFQPTGWPRSPLPSQEFPRPFLMQVSAGPARRLWEGEKRAFRKSRNGPVSGFLQSLGEAVFALPEALRKPPDPWEGKKWPSRKYRKSGNGPVFGFQWASRAWGRPFSPSQRPGGDFRTLGKAKKGPLGMGLQSPGKAARGRPPDSWESEKWPTWKFCNQTVNRLLGVLNPTPTMGRSFAISKVARWARFKHSMGWIWPAGLEFDTPGREGKGREGKGREERREEKIGKGREERREERVGKRREKRR